MKEEKDPRFGVVDVGTNSVRFEIYELFNQLPRRIYQRREIFRLGDTLESSGCINSKTLPELIQAFCDFSTEAKEAGVLSIYAAGTSVFRRADDAKEVCKSVLDASGIEIEILSGDEEASLIVAGILAFEPGISQKCLFIDIGGGSTEISASNSGEAIFSESIPLGAIRAQNEFLKNIPPAEIDKAALRKKIRQLLLKVPLDRLPAGTTQVVCSSGTARALALLADTKTFSIEWLDSLVFQLSTLNLAEIQQMPRMKKERTDIILAGAIILDEIIKIAKIDSIKVSEFSLRHGLLLECIERTKQEL